MTKPIAEHVAELKVGDWAIAEFYDAENGNKWGVEGNLYSGFGDSLIIGNDVIRFRLGNPNEHLTSITRVPRPIPSEPGFGHFALLEDGGDFDIAKNYRGAEYEDRWAKFAQDEWFSWPEIYPHIIKLYTPSGDLVTGFEYAGGGE